MFLVWQAYRLFGGNIAGSTAETACGIGTVIGLLGPATAVMPNCPWQLPPHPHTDPFAERATECACPAASATIPAPLKDLNLSFATSCSLCFL